jgi:site-specific DNA-methyltransferase (adenine-specific)
MPDEPQAPFKLRGRNPDVLSCIANLSNDEVFTPPGFANRMLDALADAWAADHNGANLWADSTVTFLDPCTKSGVFLREITSRLVAGLAKAMPDVQERVDHILTKQVFGIATTQLTSLMARRSLYCSRHANGAHSIARAFGHSAGNIWYERTEHTWAGGKCRYCGAGQQTLDRGEGFETHAYAFIHSDDIKTRIAGMFGGDMQFDVIVGNPPYQLASDGGTRDMPIYQKFVDAAITLDSKYVVMITPSRWFAGGLGLDSFRDRMLNDKRLRFLVDYARIDEVFPGVDFEGGISFFLWDRDYMGECEVTHFIGDRVPVHSRRNLGEFDVLVRSPNALSILRKVLALKEPSIVECMSTNNEFGLVTNYRDYKNKQTLKEDVALHAIRDGRRVVGWVSRDKLPKGHSLVDSWKVLIPKSYGERGSIPAQILGPILISKPPSVSTQTYVFIRADTQDEARSIAQYARTRLFRFLISLRKITQHAAKPVYTWVPQQTWDRTWTDEILYEKYGIQDDEISFIESMIRPMVGTDA